MLVALLSYGPQENIHLALIIEEPMLRGLMEKLTVRCVRNALPPFG